MPQVILEYTDNIKADADIPALLKKVNDTIIGQEGGIFPPGGTRSRAIELKDYRMADGAETTRSCTSPSSSEPAAPTPRRTKCAVICSR